MCYADGMPSTERHSCYFSVFIEFSCDTQMSFPKVDHSANVTRIVVDQLLN